MTIRLYTVRVTLPAGDAFLVGTFIRRTHANSWAHKIRNQIACKTRIEPGDHSLLGPRDFESLIPL